jgi:hypothetical protein
VAEEPLTPDARTRAADLYQAYAEAIANHLAFRFPAADPQTISDAVVRAVLQLSARPERHNPQRASLETFLTGAASRVLTALQRAEHRRRQREQKKARDVVTADASAARCILDELADRDLAEQVKGSLDLNPEERSVLDLWLLGDREVGAFAAALGLTGLSLEEQEAEVRRVLARLRQRIHRLGSRLRQEDQME